MIGLDTNVLLRWLVDESVWPDDAPGQARAARELIVESGETFFVNHVVLVETAWVLLNPMGQSKGVLVKIIERLLASSNVVIDRRECVAEALSGFRSSKPGFADHLLGRVNRRAGCETTMTFDTDAGRGDDFRRLNARRR